MFDRDLTGRTLGKFILREQIGEGGYGTVYRGEQPALDRDVVVKVLREQRADDDSRERFLREARLAARLRHPYAAQVYDFGGEDNGSLLWIAMEMVQGVSLADWLREHGAMPLDQFVPFFEGVCEAVHAAHKLGIIHRDLKPSNIMVVECDDRRFPKLLDFGIARWNRPRELAPAPSSGEDRDRDGARTKRLPVRPRRAGRAVQCYDSDDRRQLTSPGSTLGSHQYMAPEQWGSADLVGPEADIYALGIVAYQVLTGRLPFTADRTEDYFAQHQRAPVPPLGDDLPPVLDRVIQRALDKIPRARYGSALDLAAALRRALRTTTREQLRTSAQQWHDQAGPPGLLWGADVLEDALRSVPQETLSSLECLFLKDSQRRIRRTRWAKRALVATAAMIAVGGFGYRATMHARLAQEQTKLAQEQASSARKVTEVTITQAELEQGRSALLHDEPDAPIHLGRAYQLGDHSPSTAFMLARALQPRLAQQARFASTFGRVWSATFSPDGRQIATTDDRDAQIRDAPTGRLLFTLPHGNEVYQAVYSSDGGRLVTVAQDAVRIWDTSNGTLVRKLTQRRSDGKPSDYFVVALSFDGTHIAAIDSKGSFTHVWDMVTGEPLAELHSKPMEFPGLAFSSDGHWLATTGGDDVRIFDTHTWKEALTIHGPRIHRLAFDPTGPRLLTGAATGDVSIWSVPNGVRIQHLNDVEDPINAVAFSPDGQLVAAGSRDGAVQVWRAESGQLQSQLAPRHGAISAIEFDQASRLVLGASGDGTIIIADAYLGMSITSLEGAQSIRVAHFDPSSRRVIGASLDGVTWVWDATSPYRRWHSPPIADDCGTVTPPEADGRFIAVGCMEHVTQIWDTLHDHLLAELPSVSRVEGDFTSASPAVSFDGARAAIARGNTVQVYELPGGRLLRTITHGAAVNAVAFKGAGRDIASGAVDGSLLVTRDSGTQLALPTSPGGIDTLAFLSDGRVIAADTQRRMRIYDPSGAILAELETPTRTRALRVDGDHLATIPLYAGGVAPPVLVDLVHGRIIARLDGHVGRVFSTRWVLGGQLLTTGADGTTRLWDGATGHLRQTYQGRSRMFTDATFTADGWVIAGGANGLLQFWDRDGGRLLWTLHAHTGPIIGVQVEDNYIVTRGFNGELSRWALPIPGQVIRACNHHEYCAIVLQ